MRDAKLRTRLFLWAIASFLVALPIVALLVVAFFIYWLLPSYPNNAAELCGEYVAEHRLVRDEFTLRPDGTFIQTVTVKATSQVASSRGTWSYDTSDHYVTFHDGLQLALKPPSYEVDPNFARPWQGCVVLPVRYWFGRLVFPEGHERQEWCKVSAETWLIEPVSNCLLANYPSNNDFRHVLLT